MYSGEPQQNYYAQNYYPNQQQPQNYYPNQQPQQAPIYAPQPPIDEHRYSQDINDTILEDSGSKGKGLSKLDPKRGFVSI